MLYGDAFDDIEYSQMNGLGDGGAVSTEAAIGQIFGAIPGIIGAFKKPPKEPKGPSAAEIQAAQAQATTAAAAARKRSMLIYGGVGLLLAGIVAVIVLKKRKKK